MSNLTLFWWQTGTRTHVAVADGSCSFVAHMDATASKGGACERHTNLLSARISNVSSTAPTVKHGNVSCHALPQTTTRPTNR